MFCGFLRRGKIQLRRQRDRLPVEFLWKRRGKVIGAKPRLDVADGDPVVKSGKGNRKRRRGIAVHKHKIRPRVRKDRVDTAKDLARHVKQRLVRLHDIHIVIRNNAERLQDAVQHFPVLRGDADQRSDIGSALQLFHQRAHFDRFGPCAEDG